VILGAMAGNRPEKPVVISHVVLGRGNSVVVDVDPAVGSLQTC